MVYVAFPLSAGAVMFTEQVADVERLHVIGDGRRVTGLLVNVTVPVGVIEVPGDVSVTIAMHVVDCSSLIVSGAQETAVEVSRELTVMAALPVGLAAWFASPA